MLPLGALIALAWANVSYASYARVAHPLEFAINDVGMVFFFALAAKEVVEATVPGGALHTWRRAALPGVAAVGGMVVPAMIFMAFVRAAGHPELTRGWAIPVATDIAFSFLVAKAIFRQHAAIPFLRWRWCRSFRSCRTRREILDSSSMRRPATAMRSASSSTTGNIRFRESCSSSDWQMRASRWANMARRRGRCRRPFLRGSRLASDWPSRWRSPLD